MATVYFFATADRLLVKIGRCESNLHERKTSVQNGCPQGIELLGVIQCEDKKDMQSHEKALHRRFKAHNTNGEWHVLAPEISEYIQEFADYKLGQQALEEGRQAKNKEKRESQRERYQNDPEYREERLEYNREYNRKWRSDPASLEAKREYNRKWRSDPKRREERNKSEREKRKDPAVREGVNKYNREWYQRKKRKNQSIDGQQLDFPFT